MSDHLALKDQIELLQEQIEMKDKHIEYQDKQIKLLTKQLNLYSIPSIPPEIDAIIQNEVLFASSKKPFSIRDAKKIIDKIDTKMLVPYKDPRFDEIKRYLETYFACGFSNKKEIDYLHWDAYNCVLYHYDGQLGGLLPRSLDVYGTGEKGTGTYLAFSPIQYVKEYMYDRFRPKVSMFQPCVFKKND